MKEPINQKPDLSTFQGTIPRPINLSNPQKKEYLDRSVFFGMLLVLEIATLLWKSNDVRKDHPIETDRVTISLGTCFTSSLQTFLVSNFPKKKNPRFSFSFLSLCSLRKWAYLKGLILIFEKWIEHFCKKKKKRQRPIANLGF